MLLFLLSLKSYAGEFDNAYDYYNRHGSGVVYANGNFYYATAGQTSTASVRYRTLGWRISVAHNGGYAETKFKLGTNGLESISSENRDGYSYGLYRISYKTLMDRVGHSTGSLDNTNAASWITFNAIMTAVVNGEQQGNIDDWGNYSWGFVSWVKNDILYWKANEWNNGNPIWSDSSSFNNYYDKNIQINGWDKPFFTSVGGEVLGSSHTTDDGKVAWFTSNDLIRSDVIPYSKASNIMHAYVMIKDETLGAFVSRTYGKLDGSWYTDYDNQGFANRNMWLHSDNSPDTHLRRWAFQYKIPKVIGEHDYSLYVHAINDAWVWANGNNADAPIDTGFDIKIDNTAPTCDNLTAEADENSVKIKATNVKDARSGLNADTVRVAVWYGSESYRRWYTLYNISGTNNYEADIYLDEYEHINKYGTFNAHLYATDNVGNDGNLKNITFDRIDPIPHSNSIVVSSNEYKDDYTYWVKTNNPFTVKVSGWVENYSDGCGIKNEYALVRPYSVYNWNKLRAFDSRIDQSKANYVNQSNFGMGTNTYNTSITYDTGSWARKTTESQVESYFNLKIVNDGEDYDISPIVRVQKGNSELDSEWGINGVRIRSDGKAPTFESAYITDVTPFGYDVVLEGLDDNDGSGVNHIEFPTWTTPNGQDDITWDKVVYESSYVRYHVNIKNHNNENGVEYKTHVYIYDNVGNYTVKELSVVVPNPYPTNGKLEMKKYDFQEYEDLNDNGKKDSNEPLKPVYWVKPESEFGIYTDGYFPSNYNIFPTRTYVLYAKDGAFDLSNSPRQYADEYGQSTFGDEYDKYFDSTSWDPAEFKMQDDRNYISHTHLAQVKEDRYGKIHKFKLYYTNTYWFEEKEYYDKYVDSGKWLNIDGIAPTGNGLVEIDYKTLNMTITANDIKDDGSGVNSVWAMIFPYDSDSTSENNADIADFKGISEYKNDKVMERKLNRISNGEYRLTLNAYDDAFKSEMVKVVICAKDNVGNKSIIKEENVDLFTLKARIVPLNNMDYSSTNPPTLEEGQAAVLIMEVTGEAEELKIVYKGINEHDKTLDKTIKIVPVQKYKRVDDNFIVPLYCGEDRYTVEVVAYRQGKKRNASPEFIVSDSVLNGIKTRVR
jgi:hypothetical protein